MNIKWGIVLGWVHFAEFTRPSTKRTKGSLSFKCTVRAPVDNKEMSGAWLACISKPPEVPGSDTCVASVSKKHCSGLVTVTLSILFLGYGLVILSTLLLLKILRVVMEFLLDGPSERYLVFEVIFDVAFVLN